MDFPSSTSSMTEKNLMKNTPLVLIQSDQETTTLHRYIGGKHSSTLGIENASVENTSQLLETISDYVKLGNRIFDEPPSNQPDMLA